MTLHPFSKSGETDLYYTNLADKVCAIIEDSEYGKLLRNKGDLIYLSLCVTSWFEDVISQLGIWKAFTTECKQRYGTYIPFYDTDGTYTQDEINLADVKFLLCLVVCFMCCVFNALAQYLVVAEVEVASVVEPFEQVAILVEVVLCHLVGA